MDLLGKWDRSKRLATRWRQGRGTRYGHKIDSVEPVGIEPAKFIGRLIPAGSVPNLFRYLQHMPKKKKNKSADTPVVFLRPTRREGEILSLAFIGLERTSCERRMNVEARVKFNTQIRMRHGPEESCWFDRVRKPGCH